MSIILTSGNRIWKGVKYGSAQLSYWFHLILDAVVQELGSTSTVHFGKNTKCKRVYFLAIWNINKS